MFDHLVQSKVYTSNTSFTTTSPSPGQYCTDSTFKTILASICLNFTVDHIRDSIPRPWSIWPQCIIHSLICISTYTYLDPQNNNLNPTSSPKQDEHTNRGRTRGHFWSGEDFGRDHIPCCVRHMEHLQHHQDAHQPHHPGKRFLSHNIQTRCSCMGHICNI